MILDRSVGALGNWKLDEVILKQQDEKISHEIRKFMEQDVDLDRKDVSDLNAVSKGVSDLLFGKGSEKNRAEEVEWINNSLQNVFRELKFEDKEFIPAMVVRSDLSGEEIFLKRLDAFIEQTWGEGSDEYVRYKNISVEDKDGIGQHFQMYHDDKSGIYKDQDTIERAIAKILDGDYVEKGAKLPNIEAKPLNIEYTKKIRKGVNDIVQEINGKLPGKLLQEIKDLYYKATGYAYGGLGLFTSSVKIRQQNDLKKVELELKNLLRNKIMDRIVSDGKKASIIKIAEQLNHFYNPSEKEAYKGAKFDTIYNKLLEGFIKAEARGMTDSLDLENKQGLSDIHDYIRYAIMAQNPKKMPNDFADYFRGDNLEFVRNSVSYEEGRGGIEVLANVIRKMLLPREKPLEEISMFENVIRGHLIKILYDLSISKDKNTQEVLKLLGKESLVGFLTKDISFADEIGKISPITRDIVAIYKKHDITNRYKEREFGEKLENDIKDAVLLSVRLYSSSKEEVREVEDIQERQSARSHSVTENVRRSSVRDILIGEPEPDNKSKSQIR